MVAGAPARAADSITGPHQTDGDIYGTWDPKGASENLSVCVEQDQACGWPMLTIQATPNWSSHMPNSSPHICFSRGTDTLPLPDSLSQ